MEQAIRVENLEKRFGSVVALDGVSFTVPTGSVLGLLGPNGAGKTTAVRILTTILKKSGGDAEVLGIDVDKHPQAVRERIGLAGQYAAGELKARLGATIVEVGFADAATAQRSRGILASICACEVEADGHTVELRADDGARIAIDVVRALDRAGLEPVTLSLREPTLDDV